MSSIRLMGLLWIAVMFYFLLCLVTLAFKPCYKKGYKFMYWMLFSCGFSWRAWTEIYFACLVCCGINLYAYETTLVISMINTVIFSAILFAFFCYMTYVLLFARIKEDPDEVEAARIV